MASDLKSCPFCGASARLERYGERFGYGEYETTRTYHVVVCQKCGAMAQRYTQKHLVEFTSATVQDFRHNPVLRAKVEDEYEAYESQLKELAISAWQRRPE